MLSNEPTPAQIDLVRNLIRTVTPETSHAEYDQVRLQFISKEQFQAVLRIVDLEIQQHLTLIEHWHHLAKRASRLPPDLSSHRPTVLLFRHGGQSVPGG
jgi:hypothetical protein